MTDAVFTVSHVGPLVSIQDGGRPHLMRFGIPASGPLDRGSFAIANAALGNAAGTPGIEISMGGLTLDCIEGAITIALAGGGFDVSIDGAPAASWLVATLCAGSRLRIRPGHWGNWTYLAFAGQLQAGSWLGSVSTHGPSGLGGGRLTIDQRLVVENAEIRDERTGMLPCPVSARPRPAVRVVRGPQDRFFSPETIDTLFSQPFTLTDAYDRMGVRLAGPSLRSDAALDMPSEAIVRGSIQVSGDGVATVLLADHQTTGGYPKIATIVSDHLDGFVQLRSRGKVRFLPTTPEAAIAGLRTRRRLHDQFMASLQEGRPSWRGGV